MTRGSGYLQPPDVMVSPPTAEGAEAVATLRPAANGRGFEIDTIDVTLPGGGRPTVFDENGSNPTDWLPGYDGRTSITLVGGIPFDEATFEFAEPVFTNPNSTLSIVRFFAVGDGNHFQLPALNDNPFRWNWGSPQPGTYGLYAQIIDSRGNKYASEPIFRVVRPASLPEGDFTSPYRAVAEPIIQGDKIVDVTILSQGSMYNIPPRVVIEGDGSGAAATAQIDLTTGQVISVTINSQGSGYTNATISFEEGLVTTQQVDEFVLGETIPIGLTAFAKTAEIREIRLIVNNVERDEITFPTLTSDPDYGGYEEDTQEFGDRTGQDSDANIQRLDRWKYDGTMPNYNIYFTPSDVGIYNLEAKIIDHTGYSTTTSSYRIRVTNGEPPVIELLAPRTGESFALDYDRNQDIRLIAKAQDPDWQARFGGDDQMLDRRNELNRVWFFADNQFVGVGNRILGTDLYQFVWRPTVSGTYRITAVAVDDQVGDLNNEFGDIGRVGGTATSDPQYITISERSGSRPPDVYMIHPGPPKIAPGFINNELPSNDTINLQSDEEPQLLVNYYDETSILAAEYPHLYTSGSRDMLWALADDRDGNLKSLQFYINGANAVIQLLQNPSIDDNLTLTINGTTIDINASIIGADVMETATKLNAALPQGSGFASYFMPGASTVYEKSTILVDFADTAMDANMSNLSTSDLDGSHLFTWVFHQISADPGVYPNISKPELGASYVIDGADGLYFAHPMIPGINGIFSTYAVAEDYSGNRVMSVPSYYKSTTGNPQGTGSISFSTVTPGDTTLPYGATYSIFAEAESNYSIEYVEFFDNGRPFGTPMPRVDEEGVFHPGGKLVKMEDSPYIAEWTSSELGEHLIYARFRDVQGNLFTSEPVLVIVDELVSIAIDPSSEALTEDGLYHMQNTKVDVIVQIERGLAPQFTSASLYGNNLKLADLEFSSADFNSNVNQLFWTFDWNVSYVAFKDSANNPDGQAEVSLRVVANTAGNAELGMYERQLTTNGSKRALINKLDYMEAKSTVAMLYHDVIGESPSSVDVLNMVQDINETTP